MKRRRFGPALLNIAAPLLLWAIPVALFVVLLPVPSSLETSAVSPTKAIETTVGSREVSLRTSVSAELSLSEADTAMSTSTGTVTAVFIKPGDTVASGSPVIAVDGISKLASIGGTPFYRQLDPSAKGADVKQLNTLLRDWQYGPTPDTESFTAQTSAAVRRLEKASGLPVDGVFQPSDVIYIPSTLGPVTAVTARLGAPIVAGEPVLKGTSAVAAIRLVPIDTSQSLAPLEDQPTILEISGNGVALTGTIIAPEKLPEVSTALQGMAPQTNAESPDGPVTVSGLFLSLQTPTPYGTVPGSAVYSTRAGQSCVFEVSSATTDLSVVDITGKVGSSTEVGVALIPADLSGKNVVLNPSALPERELSRCG